MDRSLEFQQATSRISGEELIESLEAAREGDATGQLQVAATMTWAAFSCPDAIKPVYDNISTVWLGNGVLREIDKGLPEAPLEAGFWEEYWNVVEDSRKGVIPSRANARISALGILEAHPGFMSIAERSVQNDTRVRSAIVGAPSDGLQPDALRTCPAGSLGQTLYQMIVGLMRWVLDFVTAHLEAPHRSGAPLGAREGVRLRYADLRIRAYAARSMVYRTARLADAGENVVNEGIACKVFATEGVGEIVDTAIQLVGGKALTLGHPLERLYRRVRALRLAEGASDILRLNLARGRLDLKKGRI